MNRTLRRSPSGLIVHTVAALAILLAGLLVVFMFIFLTPYDPVSPELQLRDDDAVLVIRFFGLGVIALATTGALIASTRRSFQRRPQISISMMGLAALIVLAAVFEIFQTIGI